MAEDQAGDVSTGQAGLMGQSVLSRVSARIQAADKERSSRVLFALLAALVGFPIIAFFEHRGSSGRGYVAALFLMVFGLILWSHRTFAKRRWFWAAAGLLAIIHLVIWFLVPVHWQESRSSIYDIGWGDFFVSAVLMEGLRRWLDKSGDGEPALKSSNESS